MCLLSIPWCPLEDQFPGKTGPTEIHPRAHHDELWHWIPTVCTVEKGGGCTTETPDSQVKQQEWPWAEIISLTWGTATMSRNGCWWGVRHHWVTGRKQADCIQPLRVVWTGKETPDKGLQANWENSIQSSEGVLSSEGRQHIRKSEVPAPISENLPVYSVQHNMNLAACYGKGSRQNTIKCMWT